jgi:toxin CcdB
MAKFDVFRTKDGWLALDCQGNTLRHLNTRLVVPLMPADEAPVAGERLNPRFDIDGAVVMVTQFAASLPVAELGSPVASLVDQEYAIGAALDMLITGY